LLRSERNLLVTENLPIVGYLVNDLMRRATHLSRDDFASVGAIALIHAAEAYDASLGVPFGAFARRRILGAFADEMRGADWATRTIRKRIKDTLSVQETLQTQLGRTPEVDEIASALGVDRATAIEALSDAARTVTTLDTTVADVMAAELTGPEETMVEGERTRYIRAAVGALPEKMRYIVEEIYFKERSVKDLAEELGSTHSAVSQMRSEAVRLMRDGLVTHYADEHQAGDAMQSRIAPARRNAYLARVAEYAAMGTARTGGVFDVTDVTTTGGAAAAS
jgi:RNA polymerase sigma factor FliA